MQVCGSSRVNRRKAADSLKCASLRYPPLPTVAVLVVLVDPDGVTEAGERLQVTPAGALPEGVTVPVKLFLAATVLVIVDCDPALTVFVVGAEIVRSVSGCVTAIPVENRD